MHSMIPRRGTHFPNAERELFNDVVDEVDRVFLGVFFVDFKDPDARCLIYSCVLVTLCFVTMFPFECQELNIDLDVVSRYLFLIAFGMKFTHLCAS